MRFKMVLMVLFLLPMLFMPVGVGAQTMTPQRYHWSPPKTGGSVQGYKIFVASPDTLSRVLVATITDTTYTFTNWTCGVQRYVLAMAYNAGGDGPISVASLQNYIICPPGACGRPKTP